MVDIQNALDMLHEASDKEGGDTITVNAEKIRNCLELMLSLLETHEGYDVTGMEQVQHIMRLHSNACQQASRLHH